MLQQTRVEAVRTAFERFLARYPDPASWAAADDDELHAAWRGLGYYRRARLLREGARSVVRDHGGQLPGDAQQLGRLPGVGAYTAGAVASIAFGIPAVAIDGNVERVVARHQALRGSVRTAAVRKAIAAIVRDWQDVARPGDFNQALMELGAMVCTPRNPHCGHCPLAADCKANILGLQDVLPVRPVAPASVPVATRVVFGATTGGVLAYRIPTGEPNAGQIELPGPGLLVPAPEIADLHGALLRRFSARMDVGPVLARLPHAITNHRISLSVHAATCRRRGSLFAAEPTDNGVPWTTASRKAFRLLLGDAGTGGP
jgi:A/G-specific adenine glycosylase